jgi:predicted phage tail protein
VSWETRLLFATGAAMMLSGIAGMVRDMMRDTETRIDYMASYGEEW